MKKVLLLATLLLLGAVTMSAATKYEINIAGVEVTSDNKSHISGGDISDGYAKYDPDTKTLTLYSVKIERTGTNNYGIHNRKCDNLTIKFDGTTITTEGPALKLERSTTIEVFNGVSNIKSKNSYAVDMGSYTYYFKGNYPINFETTTSNSKDCLHGNGTSNTTVYFQGAKVSAYSVKEYALNNFSAVFNAGADLTIYPNNLKASVNNVPMEFYVAGGKKPAVLAPFNAAYSNNTISYTTLGTPVNDQDIYISDNYVAILNPSFFPDRNFREWLYVRHFNYQKTYFTSSDIASFTSLDLSKTTNPNIGDIADMTGVNWFTALTSLNVSGHSKLTSLNINSLTNLKTLNVSNCSLTALNVSNNKQLQYLYASGNKITSLSDLNSSNKSLIEVNLSGFGNNFGSFYLDTFYSLKSVDLHYCGLTSAVITSCPNLTTLYLYGVTGGATVRCDYNDNLTTIDFLTSYPTNIKELYLRNNKKLTSLNLTSNSNLLDYVEIFDCSYNNLSSLSVRGFSKLTKLTCNGNNISSLDMTNCNALKELACSGNQLTSLGTIPSSIESINAANNKFTSLSIDDHSALKSLTLNNNTALTTLNCTKNALTSLYLGGCTSLSLLNCYNNKLTSLSLSDLSALKHLVCSSNQLTSLTLPSSSGLTVLDCSDNQLTSLDLPSSVETLNCRNNKFTTLYVNGHNSLKNLDVSSNTLLTTLNARDCSLQSVDVTGCSALNQAHFQHNNLESLSMQGCNALRWLYITRNKIKGDKMTALINSLCTIPEGSTGFFGVIAPNSATPEYNEITLDQVKAAQAKRWIPKKGIVDSNGSTNWIDIPATILGDLDGNGLVDVEDVNAAVNIILKLKTVADYPGDGDMNSDGIIDVEDVNEMINIILKL